MAVAGRRTSVLVTLHGTAAREAVNVTARLAAEPAGAEEEAPEIIARASAIISGGSYIKV